MTKAKSTLYNAQNCLTFPLVHQSVADLGAARGSLLVMPTVTRLVCEGKGERKEYSACESYEVNKYSKSNHTTIVN